jgi:hypothetical protein
MLKHKQALVLWLLLFYRRYHSPAASLLVETLRWLHQLRSTPISALQVRNVRNHLRAQNLLDMRNSKAEPEKKLRIRLHPEQPLSTPA